MCSTIIIFAKLQIISVIFIFSALLKGNCATEFPLYLYIYSPYSTVTGLKYLLHHNVTSIIVSISAVWSNFAQEINL